MRGKCVCARVHKCAASVRQVRVHVCARVQVCACVCVRACVRVRARVSASTRAPRYFECVEACSVVKRTMRQLSVHDVLTGLESFDRARGNARPIKFVDLFCGCGGASEGAKQAGYEVVLAVDSWREALVVHARNHPDAVHMCLRLGEPRSQALLLPKLPKEGETWHLHGSPPCTHVSVANQRRDGDARADAVALVEWFVVFATESSATSWSMEQVATPVVMECMQRMRQQTSNRRRFDFEVIDFYRIGVPQHRRRLIAGSADVVSRLRRLETWHRCAADVLERPLGTHLRNRLVSDAKRDARGELVYRRYGDDDACVPITGPSHTVVAGYLLRWAIPNTGFKMRTISSAASASLQCFPSTYKLHRVACHAMRMTGNALPPIVMYQLLVGRRPPQARRQTDED